MLRPPSGEQFEISLGEQHATIVEVGGGIRSYSQGDRDVLEPYPVDQICDGAHGAVLVPWPNRIGDGSYKFEGRHHQLELSEPDKRTAIHGLLRWVPWRALEHEPERVLVGARLHPRPGYPFDLVLGVEYALAAEGLTVTITARNVGASAAPYGAGQHPYLSPGAGTIDACTLELPARTLVLTDPERALPCGREDLDGGPFDFREARPVGSSEIDAPFADLNRDPRGRATARLTGADGATVELWVDEGYRLLEVFTGDTLAHARRRTGLAVEPMTCPPDAFRSGEELIRLGPGESSVASWGVRLDG
ncbi:MAG TPA: aldose 1-epimerase family protein [Solirubrobacteraceae bacterium]|jgi:aldose 1-epimerase